MLEAGHAAAGVAKALREALSEERARVTQLRKDLEIAQAANLEPRKVQNGERMRAESAQHEKRVQELQGALRASEEAAARAQEAHEEAMCELRDELAALDAKRGETGAATRNTDAAALAARFFVLPSAISAGYPTQAAAVKQIGRAHV